MKKSKILRTVRLFAVLATLVLEILPYGAVCIFATPEEKFIRYYSYFSLIPYGYANFAPFITAVLTCVLLVLVVASLVSRKAATEKSVLWVSLSSAVISLAPLLLGVQFFSVVGALISVLLFAVFALSFNWGCKYA